MTSYEKPGSLKGEVVSTAHDDIHEMNRHEHMHEHNHAYIHDGHDHHDHDDSGHTHDHIHHQSADVHNHNHGDLSTEDKETYALIRYMLSHNRHHALELDELGKKLETAGKPEAARLIKDAVSWFEKGNIELEKAVRLIE